MTQHSLATQAVLDSIKAIDFDWSNMEQADSTIIVAAALRAAADQVVPEEPLHGGDQRWMYERDTRQESRKKLLAIAAELEAQ